MQSVRHRHSGVNRGGVVSRHSYRFNVRKSFEKILKAVESESIVYKNKNGGN